MFDTLDEVPGCTDDELEEAKQHGTMVTYMQDGLVVTTYVYRGIIYVAAVERVTTH